MNTIRDRTIDVETSRAALGERPAHDAAPPARRGGRGIVRRAIRSWRRYELAWLGGIVLLTVIAGAMFAPLLTPYDPLVNDIPQRLQPPSMAHPFGTDQFGRDLLTRVLYGARPILMAGCLSVCIAAALGVTIGMFGAYRGGVLDELLMRLMDVVLSFPAILLAILVVASLGAGLLNSVIAIAFAMLPLFARLARSLVLVLVQRDFVLAARCLGMPDHHILRKHILPNMLPPVLVQATAMLAVAFSTSAALNFLGLGIEPPTPDWGLMISEGQRLVFSAPHVPFFPGLAISLTVLSVNFIGDGLIDHLDPLLKQR